MAMPITKPPNISPATIQISHLPYLRSSARPFSGSGSRPPAMYGRLEALGPGDPGPRRVVQLGVGGQRRGSCLALGRHHAMMPPNDGPRREAPAHRRARLADIREPVVTAPSDAVPTSAAYLAMTPVR